jgi:hypothetical protein
MLGYGSPGHVVASAIMVVVAFLFFTLRASDESVFSQLDWAIAAAQALLLVGGGAFVLNLVIAPYKILLEERQAREQERSSLRGRIATLEAAAAEKQAARRGGELIGQNLVRAAKAGEALYAKIVASDDSWPIEDVRGAFQRWREQLREASPTASLAHTIDGIVSIADADIVGMPQGADRDERRLIALQVHARLRRLADVMKGY